MIILDLNISNPLNLIRSALNGTGLLGRTSRISPKASDAVDSSDIYQSAAELHNLAISSPDLSDEERTELRKQAEALAGIARDLKKEENGERPSLFDFSNRAPGVGVNRLSAETIGKSPMLAKIFRSLPLPTRVNEGDGTDFSADLEELIDAGYANTFDRQLANVLFGAEGSDEGGYVDGIRRRLGGDNYLDYFNGGISQYTDAIRNRLMAYNSYTPTDTFMYDFYDFNQSVSGKGFPTSVQINYPFGEYDTLVDYLLTSSQAMLDAPRHYPYGQQPFNDYESFDFSTLFPENRNYPNGMQAFNNYEGFDFSTLFSSGGNSPATASYRPPQKQPTFLEDFAYDQKLSRQADALLAEHNKSKDGELGNFLKIFKNT